MFAWRFILSWASPNDMELDRTDGQVKPNHLQLQDVHRDGRSLSLIHSQKIEEFVGNCISHQWRFPWGFGPVSIAVRDLWLTEACSVQCLAFLSGCKHTCKVGNDKAWPHCCSRFLLEAAHSCISQSQTSTLFGNFFRLAGWVFSLPSA